MTKRYLGIIPARSGSKRLPNKNKINLRGKPLVQWTIEAACGVSDIEPLVTSDDEEILSIALSLGVKNCILRPSHLSTDTATTMDVIFHAIDVAERKNYKFDNIVLLQPTSPLRTSTDIKKAINLFEDSNRSPVISVTELDHPIEWTGKIDEDNTLKNFVKETKRSQEYDKTYTINGAIYVSSRDDIFKNKTFLTKKTQAYIMNRSNSVDIDQEFDLAICELFIDRIIKKNV